MNRSLSFDRAVGTRLRKWRVDGGLTQQQLAQRLSIARTSVTNIEAGRQPLSAWLLWRISDLLERSPSDFLPSAAEVLESHDRPLPTDLTPKSRDVINRLAQTSR